MILKDCSRCKVYTGSGNALSEARVVHNREKITLYFNRYNLADARYKGRVDFYDDQAGLIIALCEILIRRNPAYPEMVEPWMAQCTILDVKSVIQRQRDIRAKVALEIEFQADRRGGFYGTIKNISAGGMYFTTVQLLQRGDRLHFDYRFRTLTRSFEAVVLWGERERGGRYGYGCKFLNLTDGAEAAIRSFVYKKLQEKQEKREKREKKK